MHALLVCKCSWRCRYLWGAMCGKQQVAFYSQFYQHPHISSDFIISIFPPLSLVVMQLRGTQWRRHMKTTFLFFTHNHTCKNATLQLFSLLPVGTYALLFCHGNGFTGSPSGESWGLWCVPVCPVSVSEIVLLPPPSSCSSSSSALQNGNREWSDMWTASH